MDSRKETGMKSKKANKPLIEKRRRARINECLQQLKEIIVKERQPDNPRFNRLEKADILEMTVDYIKQFSDNDSSESRINNAYDLGVERCVKEMTKFLSSQTGVIDASVSQNLANHCRTVLHHRVRSEELLEHLAGTKREPSFTLEMADSSTSPKRLKIVGDNDSCSSGGEESYFTGSCNEELKRNTTKLSTVSSSIQSAGLSVLSLSHQSAVHPAVSSHHQSATHHALSLSHPSAGISTLSNHQSVVIPVLSSSHQSSEIPVLTSGKQSTGCSALLSSNQFSTLSSVNQPPEVSVLSSSHQSSGLPVLTSSHQSFGHPAYLKSQAQSPVLAKIPNFENSRKSTDNLHRPAVMGIPDSKEITADEIEDYNRNGVEQQEGKCALEDAGKTAEMSPTEASLFSAHSITTDAVSKSLTSLTAKPAFVMCPWNILIFADTNTVFSQVVPQNLIPASVFLTPQNTSRILTTSATYNPIGGQSTVTTAISPWERSSGDTSSLNTKLAPESQMFTSGHTVTPTSLPLAPISGQLKGDNRTQLPILPHLNTNHVRPSQHCPSVPDIDSHYELKKFSQEFSCNQELHNQMCSPLQNVSMNISKDENMFPNVSKNEVEAIDIPKSKTISVLTSKHQDTSSDIFKLETSANFSKHQYIFNDFPKHQAVSADLTKCLDISANFCKHQEISTYYSSHQDKNTDASKSLAVPATQSQEVISDISKNENSFNDVITHPEIFKQVSNFHDVFQKAYQRQDSMIKISSHQVVASAEPLHPCHIQGESTLNSENMFIQSDILKQVYEHKDSYGQISELPNVLQEGDVSSALVFTPDSSFHCKNKNVMLKTCESSKMFRQTAPSFSVIEDTPLLREKQGLKPNEFAPRDSDPLHLKNLKTLEMNRCEHLNMLNLYGSTPCNILNRSERNKPSNTVDNSYNQLCTENGCAKSCKESKDNSATIQHSPSILVVSLEKHGVHSESYSLEANDDENTNKFSSAVTPILLRSIGKPVCVEALPNNRHEKELKSTHTHSFFEHLVDQRSSLDSNFSDGLEDYMQEFNGVLDLSCKDELFAKEYPVVAIHADVNNNFYNEERCNNNSTMVKGDNQENPFGRFNPKGINNSLCSELSPLLIMRNVRKSPVVAKATELEAHLRLVSATADVWRPWREPEIAAKSNNDLRQGN